MTRFTGRANVLGLPSSSLLALEMAGKLRPQLRSFLEAAGITDLEQLGQEPFRGASYSGRRRKILGDD
jgi:hypothetical protein